MRTLKAFIGGMPFIGDIARTVYSRFLCFNGVEAYWEHRYAAGGHSGEGSYGKLAEFKAKTLNDFVHEHNIETVIEYGCGDGNQLKLFNFPHYTGFDISETAVSLCQEKFSGDTKKEFYLISEDKDLTADLTLSLDVIYHLVEDDIFENYMRRLFSSAKRFVIIYSDDGDKALNEAMPHIKHRHFTQWVQDHIEGWKLIKKIPNKYPYKGNHQKGSFADFYIFEKTA